MRSEDNSGCSGLVLLFYVYWGIAWVVNLVKFLSCDFASPWKDEIVHGIGVFVAFPALFTAWY